MACGCNKKKVNKAVLPKKQTVTIKPKVTIKK